MNEKNRKAVVALNGRSITVLGKDGKAWRLFPASLCSWAARDPKRRGKVGFGESVWEAIRDAEPIIKPMHKRVRALSERVL